MNQRGRIQDPQFRQRLILSHATATTVWQLSKICLCNDHSSFFMLLATLKEVIQETKKLARHNAQPR